MTQFYKIIKKKNMGKDKEQYPDKHYAIANYNGHTEEDKLYDLISARSTVSSADVKVVLDALNAVLDMELHAGNIVQVGELGNFRMSLSSGGSKTREDFSPSLLRKARVLFRPGRSLRNTIKGTRFSAFSVSPKAAPDKEQDAGKEDEDRQTI